MGAVEGLGDLSLEELCDALLAQVRGTADADLVLPGVGVHLRRRPRPGADGPGQVSGQSTGGEAYR